MSNMELKAVITADDQASKKLKSFGNAVDDLGTKLSKDLKYAAVTAGAGLVAMAGFAFKSASDIQMLRTNLDVLTGSAEKGAKMFDSLYKMAAKTPFETKDLVRSTQTLLSFGIAQEKILPTLQKLGDVSLGDSFKFQQLSEAFGQVSAKGKLQGEQLERLITVGFNPLKMISDRTGESYKSLMDKMSAGKITFDMVEEEFTRATSAGGRFYGGMEQGSKTLKGTLSTLRDNITMLALKLVGLSETGDVVKGGLFDKLSTAVNNLNSYFDTHKVQIDSVITKFGEFVTKTQEVVVWLMQNKLALEMVTIALLAIAAIVGSPLAALGLIIGTLYLLYRVCREWIGFWGDMWNLAVSYLVGAEMRIKSIARSIAGIINKIIVGWNNLPGTPNIGTIPSFQSGGIMQNDGLAYLHKGERVTPNASVTNNDNGVTVQFYGNINNTANASIDAIGQRLARQIQLSQQGI